MKYPQAELNNILKLHNDWLNNDGGKQADLSGANLSKANLLGASLYMTVWPLWCGSRNVKVDKNIATQLASHFCAVECSDAEYQEARAAILKFAQQSQYARALEIL